MAGDNQRKKSGNKHYQNIHRSERKYGKESARDPGGAKAGKRRKHCPQFPNCVHTGR